MQQTGTLRKRRRRNLAKVNGLSTVPYDETVDTFNTHDIWGNSFDDQSQSRPLSSSSLDSTMLRFSSKEMAEFRRSSNASRVTRNPNFHNMYGQEEFNENTEDIENIPVPNDELRQEYSGNRSYLTKSRTIQCLRLLINFGTFFGMSPWKWNKELFTVESRGPFFEKLWRLLLLITTIQSSILTCFQLQVFLDTFNSPTATKRVAFMNSFGVLRYLYILGITTDMYFSAEKYKLYINTLLQFNRMHVEKYLIHLDEYQDRGGILLHPIYVLCCISQCPIGVSLFIIMPFQPWYLFSYIYPKPWYRLIPGAIQEFMAIGLLMTYCAFIPWILITHNNSLRFWLREIHNNNDTDYTSDELRTPRNSVRMFNAMEVLNKRFCESMSPFAIPFVKVMVASSMIPCGYVLIRSMNQSFIDDFPGILTYPIDVIIAWLMGFIPLSMMGEVLDLGCIFLDSWSQTRQKDFRRILMTCSSLWIWCGRFYFITCSTTITFFQAIFDFTVDTIITYP